MSSHPLRHTRKGEAVVAALRDCTTFRSAQDVHSILRANGERIGLTTVYRHLQALTDQGVIDCLQMDGGQTAYRLCDSSQHHHHIVCRHCGTCVELDCPDLEHWAEQTAAGLGFAEPSHVLEVYGICTSCRECERKAGSAPAARAGDERPPAQ